MREEKSKPQNPQYSDVKIYWICYFIIAICNAFNRTLSPALVAEYETKMIPKALLKRKMQEWTALIEGRMAEGEADNEI